MNQYAIGSSSWTLISPAGKSGACWLDDDGDGSIGLPDVRVIQSISEPPLSDASKGRRVFTPNGNNDYLNFAAMSESHGLYAICINPGSSAIISVDESIGVHAVKLHQFNTEPDGAIRAQLQDNESELVGVKICRKIADVTLAAPVVIGNYTADLVAGHGAVIGNIFCIKGNGRYYQATIINVATNTITLDTPHEFAFGEDSPSYISDDNMALSNGSSTAVIYQISPPPGAKWDILGASFGITDNSAMDDGKFGGITALARGIVARKVDGVYKNIFNIKTNGDFAFRCDETRYSTNAPAGVYGFSAKKTFGIRHGVVIRLDGDTGDSLQILIQDDLTGLLTFRASAWGHVVS